MLHPRRDSGSLRSAGLGEVEFVCVCSPGPPWGGDLGARAMATRWASSCSGGVERHSGSTLNSGSGNLSHLQTWNFPHLPRGSRRQLSGHPAAGERRSSNSSLIRLWADPRARTSIAPKFLTFTDHPQDFHIIHLLPELLLISILSAKPPLET